MNATQNIAIACPNCRQRFTAQITTAVDAGQDPEAKALLLSGQLNVALCPHCGHASMLATPLLYHDADKELLLTFVPTELGASELEQQRLFGDATSRIISTLPAERRKAYLLQPRSFLRLDAMIEAILEADGITPEMIAAQRARTALLGRLLGTPAEDVRRAIAQENDEQMDSDFFHLLDLNLEMAQAANQPRAFQQLVGLRSELLGWTTHGRDIALREEAIQSLGKEITREKLLEKLIEAAIEGQAVKIETMVALARPAIDYVFFQDLSERIGALEQKGHALDAQKLRQLRQSILQQTAEMDAELQKATQEVTQFLRLLLASDDPEPVLRANPDRVDGLFLSMLMSSLEDAEHDRLTSARERLVRIRDIVLRLIQESQPPEIQFINQLLSSDFPDGTRALLEANRDQLDETLIETMSLIRENLLRRGQQETADRLSQIEGQAKVALAGL